MRLTIELKKWCRDNLHMPLVLSDDKDKEYKMAIVDAVNDGTLSIEHFKELMQVSDEDFQDMTKHVTTDDVFGGNRTTNVTVKDASTQYSEKRYSATNKAGQAVFDNIYGEEVQTQSQASKARAGVLFKHLARRAGIDAVMSEHERELLKETAEKQVWAGKYDNEWLDKAPQHAIKALLDESSGSQGLEITPIEFDRDVISFPLLYGELYPQVDVRSVPRGRRIEGASISTPTMSWGGGDDNSVSLFNTASMVNAIDTTIHVIDGAIEIGRDFLSDAAVDVGSILTGLIGERLMAELDDVIANGNGTTQPEGIFTASGLTTVTFGGSTSIGNYESLMFALGKQYRNNPMRPTWVASDTSYQRARAIPVGASDARRIFGLDEASYMLFDRPYKIQNDIANTKIAFGAMAKYRMYRRLGLELRFETGGATLARRNMALLVYRARFGGKIVDSNAWAKTTDAPA